jgi:nicotinamidase-related amidase
MLNTDKLHRELTAAGIPVIAVRSDGLIEYDQSITQAQRDQAETIVAAHDPTDTDAANVADVLARWKASPMANKTPTQLYTLVQGRIDGWTSLAQAKTDLRDWLPLILAGLAWTVLEERAGQ